jgi:hypothetical protein
MTPSTRVVVLERFSPAKLGGYLRAWWDAERADLITTSTGVSSWKDVVAGYDMTQATGAAQPMWSPTSFGGFPGVTFDGIDDCLASTDVALLAALPFNADPCEMWTVVQQDALAADATTRDIFTYGGASTQMSRRAERVVVGGVNRSRVLQGNGTTSDTAAGPTTVDFSTRHVVRCVYGAASISHYLDGIAGATTASVGGVGQIRARMGATQVATAAQFWQGGIASVLVTLPLPEDKAAALHAYLMQRRRV